MADLSISTLSVVVGDSTCNSSCPFCVSKMTPVVGSVTSPQEINWRNFEKSCRFAAMKGVTTVLFTGKGEPTLHISELGEYFTRLSKHNFPFIELQTNGIVLNETMHHPHDWPLTEAKLSGWWGAGLSTIALSMAHYDSDKNASIYSPTNPGDRKVDLPELIEYLHKTGFSVRLCCVAMKGYIDSPEEIHNLATFAKSHSVEQLTIRPIGRPIEARNEVVDHWVEEHALSEDERSAIDDMVVSNGEHLMTLPHGADVFDYHGQNLCLSDCLPKAKPANSSMQVIFWPNGKLTYDWQFSGSVLL